MTSAAHRMDLHIHEYILLCLILRHTKVYLVIIHMHASLFERGVQEDAEKREDTCKYSSASTDFLLTCFVPQIRLVTKFVKGDS